MRKSAIYVATLLTIAALALPAAPVFAEEGVVGSPVVVTETPAFVPPPGRQALYLIAHRPVTPGPAPAGRAHTDVDGAGTNDPPTPRFLESTCP